MRGPEDDFLPNQFSLNFIKDNVDCAHTRQLVTFGHKRTKCTFDVRAVARLLSWPVLQNDPVLVASTGQCMAFELFRVVDVNFLHQTINGPLRRDISCR